MRFTATIACTVIGLALCAFNSTGYDPHNIVLFMFSVPVWFVELFGDIHQVSVWLIYALTIVSWALIGFFIDLGIARTRSRRRA